MQESTASHDRELQQNASQPMQPQSQNIPAENQFSPLSGAPKNNEDNEIDPTNLLSGVAKQKPSFNPLDPNAKGGTMPDGTPMPSASDDNSQIMDTGNLDKLIDGFPTNLDPSNMTEAEKNGAVKKLLDFIKKFIETLIPGLKFGEGGGGMGVDVGLKGKDGKPITSTEMVKMIPDVLKAARLINKIKDPNKEVPDKVVNDLAALVDKYKDLRPTVNGKEMPPEVFMQNLVNFGKRYLDKNPDFQGAKEIEHFAKVGERVIARTKEMKLEREAKQAQAQGAKADKAEGVTSSEPAKQTKDSQPAKAGEAANGEKEIPEAQKVDSPSSEKSAAATQQQQQQQQPQQQQPQPQPQTANRVGDVSANYNSDVNKQLNDIIRAQHEQQSKAQQYDVSAQKAQSQGYAQKYMQEKSAASAGRYM